MAREITYNNFEISLVVFMPNITTDHAITYTNIIDISLVFCTWSKSYMYLSDAQLYNRYYRTAQNFNKVR